MKDRIDTRELLVLDGHGPVVKGTYHKPSGDRSDTKPNPVESGNVGLVFLNSTSPTRAANGDTAVYFAESFARRGYPSFRIDLPGFGDSDGDPQEGLLDYINLGGYAPIAAAKIDEVVARFHLKGVIIVGHCAGSVSAIYTAAASAKCIGLIVMGPYFHLPQSIKLVPKAIEPSNQAALLGSVANASSQTGDSRQRGLAAVSDDLPDNANFPLLRSWEKTASAGVPILVLKGPDRKPAATKARPADFDYFEYILKLAGPRSRVILKVADGANQAFANLAGRTAVRHEAETWLTTYFPLNSGKDSGLDHLHTLSANSDIEVESSEQCLKA
jgi:pimeloyl-ACP methyl ester carboxylesterase